VDTGCLARLSSIGCAQQTFVPQNALQLVNW
jgi:hypothetical protein